MVATCVVGSTDTAKCADCIGGLEYRWDGEVVRYIIRWLAILICSACYWAPGTVSNLATSWFVGYWSCWAPMGVRTFSPNWGVPSIKLWCRSPPNKSLTVEPQLKRIQVLGKKRIFLSLKESLHVQTNGIKKKTKRKFNFFLFLAAKLRKYTKLYI